MIPQPSRVTSTPRQLRFRLQMHIAAIIEKKEAAHVSYGITRGLNLETMAASWKSKREL